MATKRPTITDAKLDAAIQEVEAQLVIMKKLHDTPGHRNRERIMSAVRHLLEADTLIPGVLDAVLRGLRAKEGRDGK
jgi:phosphoenolpyruvate-protein kinase (PTS system EI component)